ncbi:plasmid-related protein (plasmid) [Neobacillus sp. SCS-31]|uniref:PBECR3 domain-containing polyvalent protein n=1 Tax=Neobacillus oceani TaxID=3115292 RepID=UPI0039068633
MSSKTTITINPNATTTQLAGYVPQEVLDHYSIQCPSNEVTIPPGVLKHIRKQRHWVEFMQYYQDIPDMIANPDYAGQNPKEPGTVELYKVINDHLLLAIKVDPSTGLFLSSFYKLDNPQSKVAGRLRNGRIHPISFFR